MSEHAKSQGNHIIEALPKPKKSIKQFYVSETGMHLSTN